MQFKFLYRTTCKITSHLKVDFTFFRLEVDLDFQNFDFEILRQKKRSQHALEIVQFKDLNLDFQFKAFF